MSDKRPDEGVEDKGAGAGDRKAGEKPKVAENVKKLFMECAEGAYRRMDPQTAEHLLKAQEELCLAGAAFWETEARQIRKLLDKIKSAK
ncbi:MAG: hypothetical protein V2A74_15295 [bacterium]